MIYVYLERLNFRSMYFREQIIVTHTTAEANLSPSNVVN